jgi:hypothetical protein
MTGKTTPLYVVCSPCRCVGKTLISRLLIEFYVVKDRPVAAFDLADEGPQLVDYLPKFATTAEIGNIHGQMALFDRLIAERETPRVIDVSHRAFKTFFTILRDIGFLDEARRHSIETIILFIVDPSAASSEAYAMLRHQFTHISFITVRQIKASTIERRIVPPSANTLPSSLDIPVLSFPLRTLIDRKSFSFSEFWQVTPAGLRDAMDDQLRSWLEYIFHQFRSLEFSLGYEDPSAHITTDVSRLPYAIRRQLPVGVTPQGHADDAIDQSGDVIVAMLQKAAELSNEERTRSRTVANELSRLIRLTQDRINELEIEVEYFRNRASRAETWLQRIQREIEQKLIAPLT